MVWNEPGKEDNKQQDKNDYKDPWGRKNKNGPPNLDELLKKVQDQLNNIFKGKGRRQTPPSGNKKGGSLVLPGSGLLLIIFLVLSALMGFYIVKPAEEAAVFRFGKYIETVGPGLHWVFPVAETKQVVNVSQILSTQHQAQMLTKDENIVSVQVGVQYKVGNLADYLFNVKDPKQTLEQATDSAVRQVIGHSTLDDILTSGRDKIRDQIKHELTALLNSYKAGLLVVDVPMQPAKAPEAVKEAFDDVIKSQEDEQRSIQQAIAYEKQRVPIAQGNAQRRIAEAEAYKKDVVLQAQGNTELFLQLLPEYKKAPGVTRERLYLNTMENVLSKTSKVLIDANGSNSLMYLPLDKMMSQGKPMRKLAQLSSRAMASNDRVSNSATKRNNLYSRRTRVDYSR